MVVGDVAYGAYASRASEWPELELAALAGKLTPRLLQEVMGLELGAKGGCDRWRLLDIPVRFHGASGLALRHLCRDRKTDFGYVKLRPVEELTAERLVAAVFPSGQEARGEALKLLTRGLIDAFEMDWIALRELCHQPGYGVGEELTEMRMQAKREADARGLIPDQIGDGSSRLRIIEEAEVAVS